MTVTTACDEVVQLKGLLTDLSPALVVVVLLLLVLVSGMVASDFTPVDINNAQQHLKEIVNQHRQGSFETCPGLYIGGLGFDGESAVNGV